MKKRWAILISGTGSNLGALLDLKGHIDIRLVVSSKSQAYGLLKAKRAGVPALILAQPIEWIQLQQQLDYFRINALFLAGFMKILPEDFISNFKGIIYNVHPSLLPSYPGIRSIEKAFQDQSRLGVSIHNVIPKVDAGDLILQRQTETTESLETSEFLVHLSEQRLVREVVSKC